MLLHHLKVQGLLSFGKRGIDLPLEGLNVLIGPNSAGKSNLLAILALLQAASRDIFLPAKESGGPQEWFWNGLGASHSATIEATVNVPQINACLQHTLHVTESRNQFVVSGELIRHAPSYTPDPKRDFFYFMNERESVLRTTKSEFRVLPQHDLQTDQSILSQIRDPSSYRALFALSRSYESIRLYRNWTFGPLSPARRPASVHTRNDLLREGGDNAALLFANFPSHIQSLILRSLQEIYDNIKNIRTSIIDGQAILLVEENNGREISATRLSDSTLHYLSMLMILLHPDPPPLIAIEEPDLGLHPDVISAIADLLVDASHRTQVLVTTHSPILLDALSDHPTSLLICSRSSAGSDIERLNTQFVTSLLEDHSLGELWSLGELGGNRW